MNRCLVSVLAGVLVLGAPIKRAMGGAPTRAAVLDVQISDAAGVCVSPEEIGERVVARLGYDPFSDDAGLKVVVTIDERVGEFVALIETLAEDKPRRARELESTRCQDLIDAAVFTISLAIDPARSSLPITAPPALVLSSVRLNRARERGLVAANTTHTTRIASTWLELARSRAVESLPESAPEVTSAPELTPAPLERGAVPVTRAGDAAMVMNLTLSSGMRAGEVPTVMPELGVGAEMVRSKRWLLGAHARVLVPADYVVADEPGEVRLSSQRLDARGCRLVWDGVVGVCGLAAIGSYKGRGIGLEEGRTERGLLFGVGGSLTSRFMLGELVGVGVSVDGVRMLNSVRWLISDDELFVTPAWASSARVEVLLRL